MAAKLTKLKKVSESFTVNRYDNGFMLEISGQDTNENWKTSKVLCNTEEDLIALIKEINKMEVDN